MDKRIVDHKSRDLEFIPTSQMSGEIIPEAILIHYTAGSSLEGAVNTFRTGGVSAHLIIDRDGSAVQMVPYNRRAWHAGKSSWEGRPNLNGWSIGIELVNWGFLRKVGDQYFSWANTLINETPFVEKNGSNLRYWQYYTCIQLMTCSRLINDLKAEYGINLLLGHEEVSPGRKVDPGPAFPWKLYREERIKI